MKKITSLQHPLVKHWVALRTERLYREENQTILISGEKMIRDLSQKMPISVLISLTSVNDIDAQENIIVTEEILKKITGLTQPDGFAAEIPLPPPQFVLGKQFVLILDKISDPGNLGTLLRTALALNWEGVIFTPGTVDLFNDKALRSAKGATFHLPYTYLSEDEISKWVEERKLSVYLADIDGPALGSQRFVPPLALILSNESTGVRPWAEKISHKISLPMNKNVESLNVASSGAILLYMLRVCLQI